MSEPWGAGQAIAHLRQRPSFRWTKGQSCTNFQFGPLKWGCSLQVFKIIITFGKKMKIFEHIFMLDIKFWGLLTEKIFQILASV